MEKFLALSHAKPKARTPATPGRAITGESILASHPATGRDKKSMFIRVDLWLKSIRGLCRKPEFNQATD
ncbi:MAG: hypothetical protein WBN22_04085 [Verrucomicrobiia bacterium]